MECERTHPVVVLAGEEAGLEGRPDGGAVVDALKEVTKSDLERLAVKHRVVGLLAGRRDEVEAARNGDGLLDLRRAPLAGSPFKSKSEYLMQIIRAVVNEPVKRLSLLDNGVEAANDLLHGSARVVAVSEDDVDVGEVEALERVLHALDQVLARKSLLVWVLESSPVSSCREVEPASLAGTSGPVTP